MSENEGLTYSFARSIWFYIGFSSARKFSQSWIKTVTNDFSSDKIVGHGGFGKVYRGVFRHTDVAVKVLSEVLLYNIITL